MYYLNVVIERVYHVLIINASHLCLNIENRRIKIPRLSLYRSEKSNDYRYFDRIIKEQFYTGGTDAYLHKYVGPPISTKSNSFTQPAYDKLDPTNIQDLLFLENRDRKYDKDIYRLRIHYNVQNLDFDLSQFGLFLTNDIVFMTLHYNEMIDIVGRKLMVGDVIELPHLADYNPLNDKIPVALRKYYQITDGNYASEGFSPTWYPHLWRIKCEPLVDSQEFANILDAPLNTDNYLGDWDKNTPYIPGYSVTYGDKNYTPLQNVPAGIPCTDTTYWRLDNADTLKEMLTTYNANLKINDAVIAQAAVDVPLSGYDRQQLYLVPTFNGQPAAPIDVVSNLLLPPNPTRGTVTQIWSTGYQQPSPALRISAAAMESIWDMTVDNLSDISKFINMSLQIAEYKPKKTDTGSGQVGSELVLTAKALATITKPYGTTDNTYIDADADPTNPEFALPVSIQANYQSDNDPRFDFIARVTPSSFGYTNGYLTGSDKTPNGITTDSGTVFPPNPVKGEYFLRIDFLPQQLYRWDGKVWMKVSENVRTGLGFTADNKSQLSSFINNSNVTTTSSGLLINEKAALSSILTIKPD